MLRRTVRPAQLISRRGEVGHHGPIYPIPHDRFPNCHPRHWGGDSLWSPNYKFLTNKITGPPFKPTYIVGGVHDPIIDPNIHFNTQDRFETMTYGEMARMIFHGAYQARAVFVAVLVPVLCTLAVVWVEHRREPLELFMDREEYYQDFASNYWGSHFDHHHFSHKLAHRRANKWGYHDVTLEHH